MIEVLVKEAFELGAVRPLDTPVLCPYIDATSGRDVRQRKSKAGSHRRSLTIGAVENSLGTLAACRKIVPWDREHLSPKFVILWTHCTFDLTTWDAVYIIPSLIASFSAKQKTL